MGCGFYIPQNSRQWHKRSVYLGDGLLIGTRVKSVQIKKRIGKFRDNIKISDITASSHILPDSYFVTIIPFLTRCHTMSAQLIYHPKITQETTDIVCRICRPDCLVILGRKVNSQVHTSCWISCRNKQLGAQFNLPPRLTSLQALDLESTRSSLTNTVPLT